MMVGDTIVGQGDLNDCPVGTLVYSYDSKRDFVKLEDGDWKVVKDPYVHYLTVIHAKHMGSKYKVLYLPPREIQVGDTVVLSETEDLPPGSVMQFIRADREGPIFMKGYNDSWLRTAVYAGDSINRKPILEYKVLFINK